MKRELLRSTAIGGLFLDNNNGRGDKKATVNNQRRDGRGFDLLAVGGRLATAGMLSLGLWSMAGPALAIGGRDLTTNFNGKEENNGGDRLPMVIPISLPNDYDTDNNNSNHYWQQVTLVAADNASAAKRPVQKTQAVKKSPAVRKSPAGKKSSAVKKSPAVGKNKANTKELLVKISIDNVQADPANANRPKDKPVVKSVAQIIVPAVSPIVSKSGFYIRPEGEAILTNGTFTSDGKLGIGAGGSVFMGYRYAPNGLSAGHFGVEIGGGFFMPRLDSISEQPPEPIGPVSFGAQTNMVSRSNVVAGSFVNGLTQATTRSDAGLVAVSSANGVTFMVSQGMTQSVLDSSLSAVVTNSRNTSIANLWGKTIGGTSSRVLSNFAATDVNSSNQYIVTDNTTTTVIFGVTVTNTVERNTTYSIISAVDFPMPSQQTGTQGIRASFSGDQNYQNRLVAISEPVVLVNITTGAQMITMKSAGFGEISVTPIIAHLSGTPTMIDAPGFFSVYQPISTYKPSATQHIVQEGSIMRAVDVTTGFNVSETVAVRAQLNKTETAASKQVTETTVVDYDRVALPSMVVSKRVIADSKENYIPITVGINYSLPMGNSGFGFTMGVDAGVWVHNISRSYYFMGGDAQNYHFTEMLIKNYTDNKTIFNYAVGAASVGINQKASEISDKFNAYDNVSLDMATPGGVSVMTTVKLNWQRQVILNNNNDGMLIGFINNATTLLPQIGQITNRGFFATSGNQQTAINISQLMAMGGSLLMIAGVWPTGIVFTGNVGPSPSFVIVGDGKAGDYYQSILQNTTIYDIHNTVNVGTSATFTSTAPSVSILITTGADVKTTTHSVGIVSGLAAITSTVVVRAGSAITTLLGNSVALSSDSFSTETLAVRTLVSSGTVAVSFASGLAVADSTKLKMDQAVQVKGVIIPKFSLSWSPLDNLTFTLGGKVYIVIGGYSDYYSAEARAEAAVRGIGYKKDELLWYGGLDVGAQFTF